MNKDFGWIIFFLMLIFVSWYSQRGSGFESGIELKPPSKSAVSENEYRVFESGQSIKSASDRKALPAEKSAPINKIIIRTNAVRADDPQEEYITIEAYYKNESATNITGWTLRNKEGREIKIGQGSYLPYMARINYQQDIKLLPGEDAIIITGKSPIGTNFKMNICAGYFEQFQNFTPSISKKCPYPRQAPGLYDMKDDACIDYVEDLSRCVMPLSLPLDISNDCREYIAKHINYNGCVNDYKDDEKFYGDEWRVYLNQEKEFWKEKRGRITVLDSAGNLMGEITY